MRYDAMGDVNMDSLVPKARKIAEAMSLTFEKSATGYRIKDISDTIIASLGPEGFSMDSVDGYGALATEIENAYVRSVRIQRS